MTDGTAASAVNLVDPRPGDLVFPRHRIRPGISLEQVSRFGDLRWELAHLSQEETARSKAYLWSNFPTALRRSFMRISWALINIPTPEVLHQSLGSRSRAVLGGSSLLSAFTAFRKFARWLEKGGITRIGEIDQDLLVQYADYLGEKGWTDPHDERQLFAISRIWAYAPFLLPEDRLVMPPWEDPGAAITDFLGDDFRSSGGENREVVIHPATMSPLLVWCLRMVIDLAPDITAAYFEWQRLTTRIRQPGDAPPDGRELVRAHIERLMAAGGKVPIFIGGVGKTNEKLCLPAGERPPISASMLAGQLGVTIQQASQCLTELFPDSSRLIFDDGAPLPVHLTGRIDGEPWKEAVDFAEAQRLAGHLVTAALITIAYLSGMRPEEVLHLERGCSRREERADGTVRYRITGKHFKGVTDEDGNTLPGGEIRPESWTVIDLVDRAVSVLERLHEDRLLFPRSLTVRLREPAHTSIPVEGLNTQIVRQRFVSFIAWVNATAARLSRDHELIPDDPHGPITLRRLRRTVAWFIYRRPGGRIALGLQYGHVGTSMAESYGGRTKADMLEILDFEKTLAMADALAEASDRIEAGEVVSGPAGDRYVAAAREFASRYEGGFVSKAQMKGLRNNPRLQIFEDPQALLTCNFDPFKALCDPGQSTKTAQSQRTPNWSRCNPACANISRSDTHMRRAQAEIELLDAESADPLLPHPLRVRLQQLRASCEETIEKHRSTSRWPASGSGENV
ncbi:hypothetical protein ACQEWB_10200 [Streptomyces sp. CA-249302]|uniref:hypothetical protein n=1 Tax=Streptomyces sp. CA-249302 TaxID=3240058 RepID=UPI003D8C07A8